MGRAVIRVRLPVRQTRPPPTPHSPAKTSRSGFSLRALSDRSGLKSLGGLVGFRGPAGPEEIKSRKGQVQVSMQWRAEDLEAVDYTWTGTCLLSVGAVPRPICEQN